MWIGRLSEWDELGELVIFSDVRWAKVLKVSLKLHIFSSSDIVMDLLKRIAYFHLWGCCQWRHHRRQVCPGLQAPNTDPTIECECWRNITDEDSPAQSQVPCTWCHGSSGCRRAPVCITDAKLRCLWCTWEALSPSSNSNIGCTWRPNLCNLSTKFFSCSAFPLFSSFNFLVVRSISTTWGNRCKVLTRCNIITQCQIISHMYIVTLSRGIPDICQSRQSWRECKVRGIFSYWTRKGPLWSFVHCVLIHIQCVVLHTLHIVCNFTHSV